MSRLASWTAADGTPLVARQFGPADSTRPPVLCLPGLTRNSRDFTRLALALAADGPTPRQVIAMDLRGRGLSGPADPASYRVDVEAADVIAGLDALGIGEVDVVGTSRGGIIAMVLAAGEAGKRLGAVVLNDIGPVIETAGLVAIRNRMQATIGHRPLDWRTATAEVAVAFGADFPAVPPDSWVEFAHQIYRDGPDGRPVLDYDPHLLDNFGSFDAEVGLPPFWPAFEALAGHRLLVIRGVNSDILSEATLAEMQRRLPALQIHRVPGEAHAPLLHDAPTLSRIAAFLAG